MEKEELLNSCSSTRFTVDQEFLRFWKHQPASLLSGWGPRLAVVVIYSRCVALRFLQDVKSTVDYITESCEGRLFINGWSDFQLGR